MERKTLKKAMGILGMVALVMMMNFDTVFAEVTEANAGKVEEETLLTEQQDTSEKAEAPQVEWLAGTKVDFIDGENAYEICLNSEDKLVLRRAVEDALEYPISEVEKEFLSENLYYYFYDLVNEADSNSDKKTLKDSEISFEWLNEMKLIFTDETNVYEISLGDDEKLFLYKVIDGEENKKKIYEFENIEEINYLNYYVVDNYFVYLAGEFGL